MDFVKKAASSMSGNKEGGKSEGGKSGDGQDYFDKGMLSHLPTCSPTPGSIVDLAKNLVASPHLPIGTCETASMEPELKLIVDS